MEWKRLFLLFFTLALQACQSDEARRPSIIVIGVERLRQQDINCSTYSHFENSGFATLCGEAHRFQHAWLESTQSLPNLAAILAGPSSIGTNRQHVPAATETIAELAHARGYRTGFWSSGPPFMRSSGIMQGFESIDDLWNPTRYQINRPLREISREFLNWATTGGYPFFAALTVSDLNEPWASSVNELGEERSLSVESQIEEVDHQLDSIFERLKKRNQWKSTWIFVVGLSGRSDADRSEPPSLNLHTENMQVVLFAKPPESNAHRDLRSYEDNMSVADLGATIREVLGVVQSSGDQAVSLLRLFESDATETKGRRLRQRGVWFAPSSEIFQTQGLRVDQFLIKHSYPRPQIYNSLVDSFERTLWSDSQGELLALARGLTADPTLRQDGIRAPQWQWRGFDFWDRGIDRARLLRYFAEVGTGPLRDLLITVYEQNGEAMSVVPAHVCETVFPLPKTDPGWKNCDLPALQVLRDWIEDPTDTQLTRDLSVELSLLNLLETALRTDLGLGRPWNVTAEPLQGQWVLERILRQPPAPAWRERFLELRKAIRRKPVF